MEPTLVTGGVASGAPSSPGVIVHTSAGDGDSDPPGGGASGNPPAGGAVNPPAGAAAKPPDDDDSVTTAAAAAPFTGLLVWQEAGDVICVLCDTPLRHGSQQLKHHVSSSTHKAAVTAADGTDAGAMVPPVPHMAVAVSTADECIAALDATPSQVATLDRYNKQSKSWPASADAPHLPPLPKLSARHKTVVCYQCQSVGGSSRELLRKHSAPAAEAPTGTAGSGAVGTSGRQQAQPAACSNRLFPTVPTQMLQKGKYTRFFPVAFVRRPSAIASTEVPRGTAALSAASLLLDVILGISRGGGGGGGGGSGAARLNTTDASFDSQSGALLRMFKFNDPIREMQWTAEQVVDHFAFFPVAAAGVGQHAADSSSGAGGDRGGGRGGGGGVGGGGVGRDGGGGGGCGGIGAPQQRASSREWQLLCALKVAVNSLCAQALRMLRKCDLTIAAQLVVGAGTERSAGETRRPFSVHLLDTTVARYSRDTALLLYVVFRLCYLSRRPGEERLAVGRGTPPLSTKTVRAAAKGPVGVQCRPRGAALCQR